MIRIYDDERIYKNLKAVKVLSIISLVLSVLSVITLWVGVSTGKLLNTPSQSITLIEFYIWLVLLSIFVITEPIGFLRESLASLKSRDIAKRAVSKEIFLKKESEPEDKAIRQRKYTVKESKAINDFTNSLTLALAPLFFWCGFFLVSCFWFGVGLWAFMFGYMLIPQLAYAPSILLLRNCVLIKREWKTNPPQWYAKEKSAKEAQAQENREKQRQAESERLLGLVGKRFFVELYFPLRDWDGLDILDKIRGDYGEDTAKKRISYGKEIFKKGLEYCALQTICDLPAEKIDDEIQSKAKELMQNLK